MLPVGLAAVVVVFVAFRFVTGGTFQADDYNLTGTIVDPVAPHGVRWFDVFAEFVHPWSESGDRPFFRPFFVLVQALCVAALGVDAPALHAINLGFHLLATFLVGLLGSRCTRSVFGGAVAALAFGLHPIAVEPVAWISSLNAGVADTLVIACLCMHLAYRDRGSGWARGASLALAACALSSKESAWLLPLHLIAIEVLAAGRELRVRAVASRLWPFVPVFVACLLWRFAALGRVGLGRFATMLDSVFWDLVANLPTKVALSVAPFDWQTDDRLGFVLFGLVPSVALLALLALGVRRRDGARLGALAAMFAIALVPGFSNLAQWNGAGSRVLYPVLMPVALAFAWLVVRAAQRSPSARVAALLAALVLFASHLRGIEGPRRAYEATWSAQRAIEASFGGLLGLADAAHPGVLLAAPMLPGSAPSFMPTLGHLIATPPWSTLDVPMIGATYVLLPLPDLEAVVGDASIPRELAGSGSTLFSWKGVPAIEALRAAPLPADPQLPGGIWPASAGSVAPLSFEMVEVTTSGVIARAEVVVTGVATERFPCVAHHAESGALQVSVLDLSRRDRLLLLGLLGDLTHIEVHAFDAAGSAVDVLSARLLPRVPEITLATRLDGRVVRGLPELVAPSVDGDAPLRLIVCGGGSAATQLVVPGQPIEWSPPVRRLVDAVARGERTGFVGYFLDREGKVPGRSRLDTWHLR